MSGSTGLATGRHQRPCSGIRSGRFRRSIPRQAQLAGAVVDCPASLRAALLRRGPGGSLVRLHPQDLRIKLFQQARKQLIIFIVDASSSMGEGAVERIKAAKGAILGWLAGAYQRRDQVALIAFAGQSARVLLPPTSSVLLARRNLRRLEIGGATPLAAGLWQGLQLVRQARLRLPGTTPLLVVVSDGEANVPLVRGAAVWPELNSLAGVLAGEKVSPLIVDSSTGWRDNADLQQLASRAGGRYRHVRELHSGRLLELIREARERSPGKH